MDINDSLDDNREQHSAPHDETVLNDHRNSRDERAADLNAKPSPEAPNSASFQQRKWNRLRKHYHDQYLEIFNDTFAPGDDDYFNGDLPPTQLGTVLWQPGEKARLYQALCRKGRHDLESLTNSIGSKSVVEIRAYLDSLRQQETDRQRFEAQPKNVSHAEIPAAVEVGRECEAVLDRAADALLAFQEQYDLAAGQQAHDLWLIGREVAGHLDSEADRSELRDDAADQGSNDGETASLSHRACEMFHLSTFLDLSERIFMNMGSDNPGSWHNVAEEGQSPDLTLESVTLLYDLVVSFLRRLMQSCLFVAQSRLRASATNGYRPGRTVKLEDVNAALDVLGVRKNAKSYWAALARRNGLKIVDDAHRRGVDGRAVLHYDEVEEILSRSGRSRSVSTNPAALLEDDTASEEISGSSGSVESRGILDDSSDDNIQEPEEETLPHEEVDGELMHGTQTEDDASESERRSNLRLPKHKRLRILEAEQDEYLERMDRNAQQQEESRLLSLLGAEEAKTIKEEEMGGFGIRPPQLRKSVEDCMGWAVHYEAEWESRGKRRRLDPT